MASKALMHRQNCYLLKGTKLPMPTCRVVACGLALHGRNARKKSAKVLWIFRLKAYFYKNSFCAFDNTKCIIVTNL
jgi:hypothetical protein